MKAWDFLMDVLEKYPQARVKMTRFSSYEVPHVKVEIVIDFRLSEQKVGSDG